MVTKASYDLMDIRVQVGNQFPVFGTQVLQIKLTWKKL